MKTVKILKTMKKTWPEFFKGFIVFTIFNLAFVIVFCYLPKTSSTAEYRAPRGAGFAGSGP